MDNLVSDADGVNMDFDTVQIKRQQTCGTDAGSILRLMESGVG